VVLILNKKYVFIYCILISSLIGSNFITIVKGTTIFDRQIEIPNGTTKEIPFELTSKEGGKIKIYINTSEFLRFTILSDEEYQKYKDGKGHSYIISEDHIYNLSKTYTLSYNGSFYLILDNYYPLNEDAIVDIKVEIFEQNDNSENLVEIILIILIVIIISVVVMLYVRFKSRQKKILNEDNKVINLLKEGECEYLDFKTDFYNFNNSDNKIKLESKKEFLKDILGLVNNFRKDKSLGISYLVIGVAETNDIYNGHHQNVKFNDIKTIKDLIHANIKPELITVDLKEYYISGDKENISILKEKRDGYDRIIILIIEYESGNVFSLKKDFGNPQLGVPYYLENTSFYRDGSHTRTSPEEVRMKIRSIH